MLPPERLHLAFEDGPHRMAMGLMPCAAADWIEADERRPAEIAQRRALVATRREAVFGAIPGSEAARAETLAVLTEHLTTHHPHLDATPDPARDPLEAAGLLVQEDFCLIRPDPQGPVLEAAILCFPSRWRLHEKLGKPLAQVHAPVPLYAERLSAPVDRFMAHLRPGRIAMRMNWSLADDPALFQPDPPGAPPDPPITVEDAGTRLFYRAERQTFRLLERSGRVLFTIRVHVHPIAQLAAIPGVPRKLAGAIRALPAETRAYKGIPGYEAALLAYLDAR
jgi:dimethylamine monooxygenase subunit A